MRRRAVLLLALAALAACGESVAAKREWSHTRIAAEQAARRATLAPQEFVVVAHNTAFDRDRINVLAGVPVVVTFANEDGAVPHNFHVDAGAEGSWKTPIRPGPANDELTFTIASPGRFLFLCDVHDRQMRGEVVVS